LPVLIVACTPLACGGGADSAGNRLEAGHALTLESAHGYTTGEIQASGRIAQGSNTFDVTFDPTSTELVGANAFMPVHGHGTARATVTQVPGGYRVENVILSMPGLWDVTLDVRVEGHTDALEFTVDVP